MDVPNFAKITVMQFIPKNDQKECEVKSYL